ncbi:MAG: rhomboid family intramembrane serine protease, partial [Candidatus Levybacteria bacterium]|nr:rhomboid family intramembrane serine protease [Candidatus Levybacteria bacterium]
INVALIAATVLIFIQQLIVPDQEIFIQTYALVPSLVNFGDFATLIPFASAIFLHGGFLHIISNMWFLWVFGDNVEGRFGWFFFPIVYFASGIAGNLLQYFVMPSSSIPMLGASGAVAGVLGAYYVLFPHSRIKTVVPFFGFAGVVEIPAPFMLGYWFVLQLISGTVSLPFMGESGGVAFFAHVGGFLTGVLFAKISGLFRLHPEA